MNMQVYELSHDNSIDMHADDYNLWYGQKHKTRVLASSPVRKERGPN